MPIQAVLAAMPQPKSYGDYNNYVTGNPFFSGGNFSCNYSIDFTSFFIFSQNYSKSSICSILSQIGCSKYLISVGSGKFKFTSSSGSFSIYFRFVYSSKWYLGCYFRIFKPDIIAVTALHSLFMGRYSLTTTEFTIDIDTNLKSELFYLIKTSLIMSWAGSHLHINYPTLYLNNIRKSKSRGARSYLKVINGSVLIRLEIVCKRRYFAKMKLNSLPSLAGVTAEQIFDCLAFKYLKGKTVARRYAVHVGRIHAWNVAAMRATVPSFHLAFLKGMSSGLGGAVAYIKQLLGDGAYLEKHPFHDRFFQTIRGHRFI